MDDRGFHDAVHVHLVEPLEDQYKRYEKTWPGLRSSPTQDVALVENVALKEDVLLKSESPMSGFECDIRGSRRDPNSFSRPAPGCVPTPALEHTARS